MKIRNTHPSFFVMLIFSFIALILTSCGSGGSGSGSGPGASPNAAAGTGSVAVLFTDSPTDDFSEINITVTKIELLSDDSKVTVFSGNKTINLLDLKNETILFSVESNIPAIWYNKIRLRVSSVELIDKNGQPVTKEVKLGGNGKIDLNPRRPFRVRPGELLTIQLDLDAEKSLKLDENKNKYMFRPVIFIDIITSVPPEKLLRVSGIVRDIDLINNKFRLCPDRSDRDSYSSASSDDNDDNNDRCCVTVYVSDDTSFFSAEEDGNPVTFEDLKEGSSAEVIGLYHANFFRDDDDYDDDRDSCSMGLDAIVVQTGDFIKLRGTIDTEVNPVSNQFDFLVDPDQAVGSTDPIKVALQEGTKIYSTMGVALDESEITKDTRAEIDGKLIFSGDQPDVLNATFISLETDSFISEKLSGKIDNINDSAQTFDLITTDDTVCVDVTDDVQIFRIEESGSLVSHMIPFAELDNGDQVEIYGTDRRPSGGCFVADTIIAFDSE